MGLLSWFGRKSSTQIIDTPEKLAAAIGYGHDTYTGRAVSGQQALQLTTVFACIRVLSESMGMLPCKLFEQTNNTRTPATKHKLYSLLTIAPNNYMTAQEFWELLMVCLCLRGNFYAYKVKVMGEVVELLPIDPGRVSPKLGDNYEPVYTVTFKDGTTETLTQDDIWHVRTLTLDGLVGLNPVAYAREAIALGLATEEHGARMFKNGATPTGILQTANQLSEPAFNRVRDQFQENHQGMANSHKPMILEMGLDWKPISLNAEDSQFLETRKFQRDEICAIYRVPPHLVANLEKASFNNIEELGLSFVNYGLVSYMTRIESRINTGLLKPSDRGRYYAKFNAAALLRGNLKARFESYGQGINWGILSPNDCRELEDMNPREGGDLYLTPLNMTTQPESNNNADKEKA
ncbi:phage portal protein [Neptunomonas japonica]|uniref:Phage portal protein n=1 Tax=Neptunomonas japonica JAMM 1380 TaxID=1441457 RepID=A0A7R6SVB6_9GAMM|nr:phage portal protein [Neptunomonas japonica]BBB29369.1 phage portal protein [Neptunomonas japonica JAMM 1380]